MLVCLFSKPLSNIPATDIPYDWSICDSLIFQHLHQSFGFACPESNKCVEHMKPSYTAPFDVLTFDILTWEMALKEVGGAVALNEVFEKMFTGSPLLSSCFFCLIHYFTTSSHFLFMCTDREPDRGYTHPWPFQNRSQAHSIPHQMVRHISFV